MPSIVLYLQVHQPHRLRNYSFFELGDYSSYEDENLNRDVLNKVSNNCYLPANDILKKTIQKTNGEFKLAMSMSGVLLEQLQKYRPDVLDSFKELADTGSVELLGETYHHSLSYFFSEQEFRRQIMMHLGAIKHVFGQTPKVFRNTELAYDNQLPLALTGLDFEGICVEGVEANLAGRSPNYLYNTTVDSQLKLLPRNHKLSNDIGFRFSDVFWEDYPLNADKYVNWLQQEQGDVINLFMDYETFGEHHQRFTGIFNLLKQLPVKALQTGNLNFLMPTEAVRAYSTHGTFDAPEAISWADYERDLSAWQGNSLQYEALKRVYELEDQVRNTSNKDLLDRWSKLQTSDHFYYLSTKGYTDGKVHNYFSPFNSPYDAYVYLMNTISDLEIQTNKAS